MIDFELVLAMLLVLAAGWVSGVAAFGFTLVAVPPLLLIFDPPTVTATAILLVLVTRWIVLLSSWRDVMWRPVLIMMPFGMVGVAAGAVVLREFEATWIRLLAGIVVTCSAVLMLGGWRIPGVDSIVGAPVAGFLSGALETSTGMSAPPIVIYFASRGQSVSAIRGSMTVIFYMVAISGIVLLTHQGIVGREELTTSALLLPCAIVGTVAGQF